MPNVSFHSLNNFQERFAKWANDSNWIVRLGVGCGFSLGLVGISSWGRIGAPVCPFHKVTGLWCPGCGLTRAMTQLVQGDVAAAVRLNVFAPAFFLIIFWSSLTWVIGSGLPRLSQLPAAVWRSMLMVLVAFAILRNLGPFWWLRPR